MKSFEDKEKPLEATLVHPLLTKPIDKDYYYGVMKGNHKRDKLGKLTRLYVESFNAKS